MRLVQSDEYRNTVRGFANRLFMLWILSLPFYQYSIVGSLSIDNLLAPILLISWGFMALRQQKSSTGSRTRKLILIFCLIGCYICSQILAFANTEQLIWERMWRLAKLSGYFLLPILYIKDLSFFRKVTSLLVIDTILGCISVFLVSIGLLELNVTRFEQSRLGYEWLPKAIGFFTNYGDLALLVSFTAIATVALQKKHLLFGLGSRSIRVCVFFILFLGITGAQSRTVVLTLIFGLIAFYIFHFLFSHGNARVKSYRVSLLMSVAIILFPFFVLSFSELKTLLSALGGQTALANATVRLESYEIAFKLFQESPILGLGPEEYKNMVNFTHQIHNMWFGSALLGGILALIPLLLLIALAFIGALRKQGDADLVKESHIVKGLIISMLIATLFYPAHSAYVFWVILGITHSFWAQEM